MSQLIIRTDNLIITDPALKHEIEDVLSSGFRLLRFPDYLEQHFARSYRKLALKLHPDPPAGVRLAFAA